MNKDLLKIFDFLHQVENFKSTLRIPVTKSGRQESAAEHTWRVSLMAFLVAEEFNLDINIFHATKIAIVHDLAECITGDYCSYDVFIGKLSKTKKEKEEKEAMKKLQKTLSEKSGDMIYNLWKEYENQKTKEAKYIKALERIETLTQFIETDPLKYKGVDYTAIYADDAVKNFPQLKDFLVIIKKRLKEAYKRGGVSWKKEYDLDIEK